MRGGTEYFAIFFLNFPMFLFFFPDPLPYSYFLATPFPGDTSLPYCGHLPRATIYGGYQSHPGLTEITAPNGSQDVMSQLKDYPFRQ